jgi:hypothetical protein
MCKFKLAKVPYGTFYHNSMFYFIYVRFFLQAGQLYSISLILKLNKQRRDACRIIILPDSFIFIK